MGVYDCLILVDYVTANICSLQKIKNVVFFSLEFGGGEENCCRKSQAEFPLLFVIRAGKRSLHRGLAGILRVPSISLEAGSASVQQPMGLEQATEVIS